LNILILTGSFGMGHNSAANTIAEMINGEMQDSRVYVEDLFAHAFKSTKHEYVFRIMIKRGKYFYNLAYRRTEDSYKKNKYPFQKYLMRSLDELVVKTDADIIISTLWICSKLVCEYKQSMNCNIPLITCITDVWSHNVWINPGTDFYMTATPKVKDELIGKGVEAQRVVVSGIPVGNAFKTENIDDKSSGEKRLLIMGGGLGLLPKTLAFYEELNKLDGVKTTIITGNNIELYNLLNGRYENIEVLAFVNNVYHYMKNADLLISKPGGITLFEAIFAELPLLMFKPFLEPEKRNGEFVLANNMGAVLSADAQEWVAKIAELMWNNELLNEIRANMRKFKSHLDQDGLFRLLQQCGRQSVMIKIILLLVWLVLLFFVIYSLIPTMYYLFCKKHPFAIDKNSKRVLLMFEDGPDPRYTISLLDILKKHKVQALFFVVAKKAADNPAIIHRMIEDGHLIGLHSFEHGDPWLKGPVYQERDFTTALAIMKGLGCKISFYQPPWGHLNLTSLWLAKKYHLKIILWTVMIGNWKKHCTSQKVLNRLIQRTKNGSVICLHDSGYGKASEAGAPAQTLDAVAQFLPLILKRGYQFVLPEKIIRSDI